MAAKKTTETTFLIYIFCAFLHVACILTSLAGTDNVEARSDINLNKLPLIVPVKLKVELRKRFLIVLPVLSRMFLSFQQKLHKPHPNTDVASF